MTALRTAKNDSGMCAVAGCPEDYVPGLEFRGRVPAELEDMRHIMSTHLEFVAKVCKDHYKTLTAAAGGFRQHG